MITWTQRPQTSYEKLSEEVVRGTCTCQYHLLNMTFQCEVQIIIQIRSGDLDLFSNKQITRRTQKQNKKVLRREF